MNAAYADLRSYKTLTTRDFFPARSGPNYEPSVIQIFSEQTEFKYAFLMSDILTSRSFNAASVRLTRKISHESTLTCVNVGGETVT